MFVGIYLESQNEIAHPIKKIKTNADDKDADEPRAYKDTLARTGVD